MQTAETNCDKHFSRYSDEEKEQLVHQRMGDVRYIASQIHNRLPQHISFEDLLHDGVVGLIDAAHKYDLAKKASFRTYARFRIRGAIIDSMRQMDWAPRSIRREYRRLERAEHKLTHSLGRYPVQAELAVELGMSVEQLQDLLAKVDSLRLSSLSVPDRVDESRPIIESLHAGGESNPLACLLDSERKDLLCVALEKLSANDRQVLSLYYFEEYSLKEVGKMMGFGEARASQVRSRAVRKLREIVDQLIRTDPAMVTPCDKLPAVEEAQL